uniref:Uncharacterized protein n=1 Tax=Populus davidiana TaxID=266767 RepID=A0A6M2F2B4_9ROSI
MDLQGKKAKHMNIQIITESNDGCNLGTYRFGLFWRNESCTVPVSLLPLKNFSIAHVNCCRRIVVGGISPTNLLKVKSSVVSTLHAFSGIVPVKLMFLRTRVSLRIVTLGN